MLGEFVDDYTVRVVDVFAMPQSGTGVQRRGCGPRVPDQDARHAKADGAVSTAVRVQYQFGRDIGLSGAYCLFNHCFRRLAFSGRRELDAGLEYSMYSMAHSGHPSMACGVWRAIYDCSLVTRDL